MSPAFKYSYGRLGLFAVAFALLFPFPLNILVKAMIALVVSAVSSYFVLAKWRNEMGEQLSTIASRRSAEKERLRAALAGDEDAAAAGDRVAVADAAGVGDRVAVADAAGVDGRVAAADAAAMGDRVAVAGQVAVDGRVVGADRVAVDGRGTVLDGEVVPPAGDRPASTLDDEPAVRDDVRAEPAAEKRESAAKQKG